MGVRKIWPTNCPVKPTRATIEPTAWRPSIRWSHHGLFSKVAPVSEKRALFFFQLDLGERGGDGVAVGDEKPEHTGDATF